MDISNLKYPQLVQPLYKDPLFCVYLPVEEKLSILEGHRVTPSQLEFIGQLSALQRVKQYNLDGMLVNNKLILYDISPADEFVKEIPVYEDRLKLLRSLINTVIADYTRIIDIPTDEVNYPFEIKALYRSYLDKGYRGVRVRSPQETKGDKTSVLLESKDESK